MLCLHLYLLLPCPFDTVRHYYTTTLNKAAVTGACINILLREYNSNNIVYTPIDIVLLLVRYSTGYLLKYSMVKGIHSRLQRWYLKETSTLNCSFFFPRRWQSRGSRSNESVSLVIPLTWTLIPSSLLEGSWGQLPYCLSTPDSVPHVKQENRKMCPSPVCI